MTPQPQKEHPYALQEYIITEHELFLYESNGFWDRSERRDISALIRSRPTPSPQPTDEQCHICSQAIRNATLDALEIWVKENNTRYEDADGDILPAIVTGRILNKIYSLRTPSTQEQP